MAMAHDARKHRFVTKNAKVTRNRIRMVGRRTALWLLALIWVAASADEASVLWLRRALREKHLAERVAPAPEPPPAELTPPEPPPAESASPGDESGRARRGPGRQLHASVEAQGTLSLAAASSDFGTGVVGVNWHNSPPLGPQPGWHVPAAGNGSWLGDAASPSGLPVIFAGSFQVVEPSCASFDLSIAAGEAGEVPTPSPPAAVD